MSEAGPSRLIARVIDFDRTAADPWAWRSVALSLLFSARELWEEIRKGLEEFEAGGVDKLSERGDQQLRMCGRAAIPSRTPRKSPHRSASRYRMIGREFPRLSVVSTSRFSEDRKDVVLDHVRISSNGRGYVGPRPTTEHAATVKPGKRASEVSAST